MKTKNPLYVVKGKDVHEASSLFDMVLKKFNLEPAFNLLRQMVVMLLEQVETFAMFQVVKAIIDQIIARIRDVALKLGMIAV